MNLLTDLERLIPDDQKHEMIIRVSGALGGTTFLSGFALSPTWFTAIGQFLGGLAAFIAIIHTIYKGRRKK